MDEPSSTQASIWGSEKLLHRAKCSPQDTHWVISLLFLNSSSRLSTTLRLNSKLQKQNQTRFSVSCHLVLSHHPSLSPPYPSSTQYFLCSYHLRHLLITWQTTFLFSCCFDKNTGCSPFQCSGGSWWLPVIQASVNVLYEHPFSGDIYNHGLFLDQTISITLTSLKNFPGTLHSLEVFFTYLLLLFVVISLRTGTFYVLCTTMSQDLRQDSTIKEAW